MKRLKFFISRLWLLLLLFAVSLAVEAKTYRVDDVPNVRLSDIRLHVSDPEAIVDYAVKDSINRMLTRLEQTTSIEVAVVVVPAVEGGDCFDFAINLGRKWGVGKKNRDNGLVILLATEDRCVQFVTGYGIEGDLPDAICKRIQIKYMNDRFAQGDWNGGLLSGVAAVCKVLDGTMKPEELKPKSDDSFIYLLLLGILGFFGISLAAGYYTSRNLKRCSNCGKYELKKFETRKIMETRSSVTYEVTYVCAACGHVVRRQERKTKDNGHGGIGGGPIIFGGFGGFGGGSGGGFGGGSFGGGSFGGGGGGSRF